MIFLFSELATELLLSVAARLKELLMEHCGGEVTTTILDIDEERTCEL